jgi:20S proteasome subunit alpha 6
MPHSEKQSADHAGYLDTQVSNTQISGAKPLQTEASLASTIPDEDMGVGAYSEDQVVLELTGEIPVEHEEITMHAKAANESADQEHLPEPPASPTSNTLLSTSSGSTYGEPSHPPASTAVSKGGPVPSANRLSISYAAGSRRLVVDAEVVEYLKVYRSEGRIEVHISLDKGSDDGLKGVLIEGLSDATKSYSPLPTLSEESGTDETLPSFSKATLPSKITLMVHLDTERPLSEPKWVKSGDVQEWLKSMFGRMFWVAGDAADGWEKKIAVADPDPAPTIWTVLDGWAVNSPVGVPTERQRFVKTHLTEVDNMMEILLRLVRGERATPFSQSTPAISAPSVSGPLLAALSQSSSHGAQQTHVSLAVLALFHMSVDFARKASGDKGKAEAEEKMSEIIRCLPSHLLYKSLDGMFKEWRADKKGSR